MCCLKAAFAERGLCPSRLAVTLLLLPLSSLAWRVVDLGAEPSALAKRRFQVGWSIVLLEKVAKSFVRQFLKIHHAITRQQVERQPGFVIKLDSFAAH
jgi:hypothetical protein